MISKSQRAKYVAEAKSLGFVLKCHGDNDYHNGTFTCNNCGDEYVRNMQNFLLKTRQCPTCNPRNKHQKRTPVGAAMLLLEHGVELDKSTYTAMMNPAWVKCVYCGYEYETTLTHIRQGINSAKCPCIRKPRKVFRDDAEAIELLKSWGLIVIEPSTYSATKKFKVRCARCKSEWMDSIYNAKARKYKCVECDGTVRAKSTRRKWLSKPRLTKKEELRRIDAGLKKLYKDNGWDGTYFFERDSVEQFNLLEKIRNVAKEHDE